MERNVHYKKHKVYLSIYRIYLNFLQLSTVQLSSDQQVDK